MCFPLSSIRFLFLLSSFINTFVSPTKHLCHPDQRDALLEFKNEFRIQKPDFVDSEDVSFYPKTKSWVDKSDCCSWDGITCDARSGKVIGLDLSFSCLYGELRSNSSLFRLIHLRDLNLAYNNFTACLIPSSFDKFMWLERLNLSCSSLSGQIPTNLLQLKHLVSLDLSSSLFMNPQSSPFIDESFFRLLALNLRNIRELDMSYVNISSEIPQEFSYMWSLRSLRLVNCNLLGRFPKSVLLIPNLQSIILDQNLNLRGNLPVFRGNNSMKILSLSETSFSGTIPDSISNLKHLVSLTLSYSGFSRKIPFSLGNLSHLSHLDLSSNNFVGAIPSSIGNLQNLIHFDVDSNNLSGNFPSALLNLTQLRSINLCFNQLTGFLPPNISQISKLEDLFACYNSFTGAIPSSFFKISSLTKIHFHNNQLNDLVGIENISMLPNLLSFLIDDNHFKVGLVDLNVFSPLKQLVGLSLSGIPLSTRNITADSDFSSYLEELYLSDCNITEFPEFIRNQRNLVYLDLSNNKIKGQVPDWLWRLSRLLIVDLSNNSFSGFKGSLKALPESMIFKLDISSNNFQGPLFFPSRSIQHFLGSKNNFTGDIPRSICGVNSLYVLDLSNNNLHGSIPWCLATHMSSLSDLILRNNCLSGSIPDIFMHAKELRSLDVSHNQLEGNLAASLTNCSALEVLNVANNGIDGVFPFQLNSLEKLQVLVLSSNKFHGTLHNAEGSWFGFPQLKIIDVSHNDFIGTFPSDYFLNWTAISSEKDNYTEPDYIGAPYVYGYYTSLVLMSKGISLEMERILTVYTAIDFSGNQLHGKIPYSVGLLKELRILNLSNNAFTGQIPSSLVNLTKLESLDLSQNKISGEIPPELGTLSSLAWINVSHNQLVGPIPQGTQFQRQNCSSYKGNPGLNGPSLKDICGDINTPISEEPELPESEEEDEEEEEEEEQSLSWIAVGLGVIPGVVYGLTMGYIVASHKHEWFMKTFGISKNHGAITH